MSLNRVMMIRNLGQDPEIRYTVSTVETAPFRRNWISEPALTNCSDLQRIPQEGARGFGRRSASDARMGGQRSEQP